MKNKPTLKFILIVLLAAAGGGVLGGILIPAADTAIVRFFGGLGRWLFAYYVYIQAALAVAGFGLAGYCYQKSKNMPTGPEDEESFEKADALLSRALMLLGTLNAATFTLFGVFAVGITSNVHGPGLLNLFWGIFPVLVFLAVVMGSVFGEVKIVGLIKARNPEKQGNPLEFRFQKDWLASCDEAERYVIFNASYKSFQTLRYAIIILWGVSVIAGLFFGTGLLPVVLMGILFGIHGVSYQQNVLRFSKDKIRE